MAIGFIGTGWMGSMLVRALLGADRPLDEELWASNRSPEKLDELSIRYPRLRTGESMEVARECRTVFLCVRPADTGDAIREIRPALTSEHLLIAITNVIELERLAAAVPCRTAKIIPSIAQYVRRGISLLIPGPRSTPQDLARLHDLLGRVSKVYEVAESQTRAVANVVGCGPGFLACFCAEWADAAHRMQPEIPREEWDHLVWETVRAVAELPRAGIPGRQILAEVSTPGGMTFEGVQAMDRALPGMWSEVMERTALRERELRAEIAL
jgi:competence protein ComER